MNADPPIPDVAAAVKLLVGLYGALLGCPLTETRGLSQYARWAVGKSPAVIEACVERMAADRERAREGGKLLPPPTLPWLRLLYREATGRPYAAREATERLEYDCRRCNGHYVWVVITRAIPPESGDFRLTDHPWGIVRVVKAAEPLTPREAEVTPVFCPYCTHQYRPGVDRVLRLHATRNQYEAHELRSECLRLSAAAG